MKRRKQHPNSRASPPFGIAGSGAADRDPSAPAERLLNVIEVAYMLCVSRGTVYNLISRGALPGLRVSHLLRLRRADVVRYMKRRGGPLRGRRE